MLNWRIFVLLVPLLVISLYLYLSFFENALIDDAFIAMQYARTLAEGGTWGFFPDHAANSVTSPLHVILLTCIAWLTTSTIDAVKCFTLINFLCLFFLLYRISIKSLNTWICGIVSFIAIVCNPLLLSTIGLEGILFTTLLVASIDFYIEARWQLLALSTGLLTITRPDGILCFSVFLVVVPTMKLRFKFIALYILCLIPWYLFSWIYLGSLVPDTLFIKTFQKSWGRWQFFNGILLYYEKYPLETLLSFLFFPLLFLFVNSRLKKLRKTGIVIGTVGLGYFVSYSLLGIPPYHWYYIPQVIVIILGGAFALTESYYSCIHPWRKKLLYSVIVAYIAVPVVGMFHILERDGFYLKEAPIHTNWATHGQYKEVGLRLRELSHAGGTFYFSGEIGTLAFYCRCYLLGDSFSDRRWLKKYIRDHTLSSTIKAVLFKINFMFYKDDSDFPSFSYRLAGHTNRDMDDNLHIMKWETSTKWIPQGLLTLRKF